MSQTYKQQNEKLKSNIDNLTENNRALRKILQENLLINPRTKEKYAYEASQMFVSLALIEQQLRIGDDPMTALIYAQGILSQLGFNFEQIVTDHCLKDDVYTNG